MTKPLISLITFVLDNEETLHSLLTQSDNTPLLPPKLLHNHCLQFLLGHENVPREFENNAYADFWG